ncbi:MAG: acetylornithine/succinylornithine family transaminase [Euryarchaeota archaeon]|nr:acetylornithine/succinylornithine family transaminase [Euryarchaeota archaeon]
MNTDKVKELDRNYLFQNYGRQELCFKHGEKEFLYDLDDRRYIDLVAGIAVNSLGYAHPAITQIIAEQSKRLIHVSNLYLVKEQAEAAAALASVCPSPLSSTLFVNSGTEANEAALKLAFKRTGRSRVVATYNSFHGRTSGALSVTGQSKYQEGFEPLISEAVDLIDYGNVEQLKDAVTKDTAALILEPIQGEGGVILAEREFFRTARDLCDERGALFICDEVQTGMCRTGRFFGFQHYDVVPDIISLAKALGNGYPIGAIVTSGEIASTFTPGAHGTTFGGNPLGTAIAKTVIETMVDEKIDAQVAEKGSRWMSMLHDIMDRSEGRIKEIRGQGLLIGIEMGKHAKDVQTLALDNGILVNVCAGSVVRLIPPLILSESSILAFNDVLNQFLE